MTEPEHGGRLDWGTATAMNPLEAMMWRGEGDPILRSTIVAIELLDRAPDWQRLLDAHDWAVRMVPRLRKRVVEPPSALGVPRWSTDPEFDLHYHVRRAKVPDDGGAAQAYDSLFAAAEQVAMTPFDRSRPPWEAVLYEGLPDGRAAYLLKLHHSSSDGLGIVQLLGQLHSPTRGPRPGKPQPEPAEEEPVDPLAALGAQAAEDARGLGGLLRDSGAAAVRALGQPGRALHDGVAYGRSLYRVLSPPAAEPSPLLAQRSPQWRFLALDVAFGALRGAAKAVGASLNDAYLAALLGAFRRYHDELGAPVATMPVTIPVSTRTDADAQGGNRIAQARLAAPVGIADPRERIATVREQIRLARAEPALNSLALFTPLLARLPGPVIGRLAGGMTRGNDLQASNVPGTREPVHLAGAQVQRIYPYAPRPGCPAMISLVTHGDTCCVGANLDPAAITDLDLFGRCLVDGVTEVLALGPEPGPNQPNPVLRRR